MPVDIVHRFKKLFGFNIVDFWGMTESTAHVTCQSVDGDLKIGSVGKVLEGWDLRVVDDSGRVLPANEPGELIVRGPVMVGYYRHPDATARILRDGWLHTGDLGLIDGDGNVFLTGGMKKNMFIVKGQNIYPSDIEEVISTYPKVAEVAVVGVPDEVWGKLIRAVVRLKPGEQATEQEIKKYCLERLVNYKVPKEVTFVDSLPKTSTGEIRREELV